MVSQCGNTRAYDGMLERKKLQFTATGNSTVVTAVTRVNCQYAENRGCQCHAWITGMLAHQKAGRLANGPVCSSIPRIHTSFQRLSLWNWASCLEWHFCFCFFSLLRYCWNSGHISMVFSSFTTYSTIILLNRHSDWVTKALCSWD